MANQILTSIPPDELMAQISQIVQTALQAEIKNLQPHLQPEELITREEACKLLGITLPTLHSYTKDGKVPAYRVGTRIRYKKSEVLNSLQSTLKYRRTAQ